MRTQMISDRDLIRRYQKGNERALAILVNRHKERIFTYIMTLVRKRTIAEDVFQETFMKAIKTIKAGGYNDEGKFVPWLNRIAHNLVVDNYRKAKKMPLVHDGVKERDDDFSIFDVLDNGERGVDEDLIEEKIHADLHELIELLPDEQKEILKLRIFSRVSFKDIADEKNISINTALGRMRYALINLRKIMEEKKVDLLIN